MPQQTEISLGDVTARAAEAEASLKTETMS